MRQWIKRFVQRQLEGYARKTLKHYKPVVIGVAGSIGKTSTKEAIYAVLSKSMSVRKSAKSYNNEFGVPLTVLGLESAFSSPTKWLLTLMQAQSVALGNAIDYPECIILEMGSDHLGDVHKLMSIAHPNIGVLTAIAPVHLEFFETFQNVKMEESTIVRELDETDAAIVNGDDLETNAYAKKTSAESITFGFSESSQVRGTDLKLFTQKENGGFALSFKLHLGGETADVLLPHALSTSHAYAALAAATVGKRLQMSISEIVLGLAEFVPPPGRMRYIEGIKRTHIIDDTYNSSPMAAEAALDVLKDFPTKEKRYAVLGDMAELGQETKPLHLRVGSYMKGRTDILIAVGEKARDIAHGAREAGMKEEDVFSFALAEDAGKFLQDRIKENDAILIKGSQVARLEKVVKEVMAEPNRAAELLVRQEEYWQK
ncbi:MAG: UDP-N-acetylmuramoyl-tripeptide--D-alanyl-D-alanine ligase [Patescibacteria group bacterium]